MVSVYHTFALLNLRRVYYVGNAFAPRPALW